MSENKTKSEKDEIGYKSDSMNIDDQDDTVFNTQGNLGTTENNQINLDTEEISD